MTAVELVLSQNDQKNETSSDNPPPKDNDKKYEESEDVISASFTKDFDDYLSRRGGVR